MTVGDANDPLLRALARLPAAAPDEARAVRVQARCRTVIERARLRLRNDTGSDFTQNVKSLPVSFLPFRATQIVEAVLVGGLCVLYLSTVILEVVRLRVW